MHTRTLITTGLIAVMACKEPPTSPSKESPTSPSTETPLVEAFSPLSLTGVVGATAATVPAVRLTDKRTGAPFANIAVDFIPKNGGGVTTGHTMTDADGVARAGEWTFSTRAGTDELSVEAFGRYWLSFRATLKPDVPARLFANITVERVGLVGDKTDDVVLFVKDRFQNSIQNIAVTVSIVGASGSVSDSKLFSDEHGIAVVNGWTLDSMPGTNSLTASIPGVEPLVLRARGVDPATVKWYQLDSLSWLDDRTDVPLSRPTDTPPRDFFQISDSRIGFTSFDGCVCLRPEGYYIRMIRFSNSLTVSSWSGAYTFSGNELSTKNGEWSASLDGDVLVMRAFDPWDGMFLLTWLYRVAR